MAHGGRDGVAAGQDLPDDRRVYRGRPEGVARERGGKQQRRVPELLGLLCGGLGRVTATAADHVHDALEDGVVRRRGLFRVLQVRRDALRRLYPVAFEHAAGVFEGRTGLGP